MKRLLLAGALALCLPVAANAELVQATNFFLDLHAEGFGDAHRLLTLQTTPLESGATIAGVGGATILSGDAVPGADKSAVANAGTLGWTSGANVGLGLNIDVEGASTGFLINSTALNIYNAAGGLVDSFGLASPLQLNSTQVDEQRGNGTAVFNFVLNAAEQAQFNADLIANGGAAALFVGLSSNMGCASGSLTCEANDGPDSWLAFNQTAATATPLPGAVWLFGGALALFGAMKGWVNRRRRGSVSLLGAATA